MGSGLAHFDISRFSSTCRASLAGAWLPSWIADAPVSALDVYGISKADHSLTFVSR